MEENKDLSRRCFIKSSAIGVAAMAGTGLFSGCAPKAGASSEATGDVEFSRLLAQSTVVKEPISGASDGGTYDVIVIGAGTSGVPCAVSAYQSGAKVLLLQKEKTVVAQGNSMTGILLDQSSPTAVRHFLYLMSVDCTYRNDHEQMKVYVYNSGEAAKWYSKEINNSGYKLEPWIGTRNEDYGAPYGKMVIMTTKNKKPEAQIDCLKAIIAAYKDKFDIKYEMPVVQLIKEGKKIVGVYAKGKDGAYHKFLAKRGVVVATGDYQNNEAMVEKYCPDVKNLKKRQYGKTGDGILMGIVAGAVMEPIGHTKMVHDGDSGPMPNEPFLKVDMDGKRFINERVTIEFINNYMRHYDASKAGKFCHVWDGDYMKKATQWGGKPEPESAYVDFMPEVPMEKRAAYKDLIATYKADTLEDLAKKLMIPVDTFLASVKRFNEWCDKGFDDDFGLDPKYLKKIERPPFYGCRKNLYVAALMSGILINKDFEVLDAERKPIENLYAIGNCSGAFYASPDYPLRLGGMSVGRCVTSGYLLGKRLAGK